MKTTKDKIKNLSRLVYIGLNIAFSLVCVAAILCLVGFFIAGFASPQVSQSFSSAFNITGKNGAAITVDVLSLQIIMACALVFALMYSAQFFVLKLIFKDISIDGNAFCPKHTKRIKIFAGIVIAVNLLNSLLENLVSYYTLKEFSFGLELGGALFGLLLYCVAIIYDYGCELQQQSDETL